MAMGADRDPVTGFAAESARLAPLETFDPAAFRESAEVPEELCNFVLALAVVYNDFKDAIYAHVALADCKPQGQFRRTRAWGANVGARGHLIRIMMGMVHELLELITKNQTQIEHQFFQSVVQRLGPKARDAWTALVNAATASQPRDPLARRLLRFRNAVAFHYEPNAFGAGYKHHFDGVQKSDEWAFVSRGATMRESRLYFADAAAIGYARSVVGDPRIDDLLREVAETVDRINRGLFLIVEAFIQRRGCAFRDYREEL